MKTAILIPAFNAAATLQELLQRTLTIAPQEQILVVDDGSFDNTSAIANSFGTGLIIHKKNKGKGAALQSGFNEIVHSQFEAVLTMDADLQHEPEQIPNFIQRYCETKADIIIGSRLHNVRGMPILRIFSNTITTFLVEAKTGKKISDSQSGFRFITRDVLKKIQLTNIGFEAETEFILKAAKAGFQFDSIPIPTIYGNEKSNMTHFYTTYNFLKVLLKEDK